MRAHGRLVHLLAAAGASPCELVRLAAHDTAVIVAAIIYVSHDRADYAIVSRDDVRRRLISLLQRLPPPLATATATPAPG